MFDRALIALDLSPAEQPLLDCLPALQRWGVRHLVLAHVIQFGYGHGAALARQQDYVDWLEKCAGPLRATDLSVEVEVRASGAPADAILALARGMRAPLIVIGSRAQNTVRQLFLGSVARAVIHKTTVPLLLEWIEPTADETRARCEAVCTDSLRHIVFSTDFSRHAAAAEKAVLELAPRAQKVECVHVLAEDETAAPAQAAMAELLERFEARGGHAEGALLRDKPSSEIARHAASEGASLIVIGKQGRNWLARTLIGSTAADLCEIAGRPVLMCPLEG